jgi:N-carbamoylputrescine amidase
MKVYLPDASDGWEATWFERGTLDPAPLTCGGVAIGFEICTEMLFTDLAWKIGRPGAQIIAAPRVTGGHPRWRLAASLVAIMSGCFVASANRRSYDSDDFAGQSCIVSPEGDVLAETTADAPVATVTVDLRDAVMAKQTYPRNLPAE